MAGSGAGAGGREQVGAAVVARDAVALACRAAPGTSSAYLVFTLAGAVAPVATAWCTKRLLDLLTGAGSTRSVVVAAAGLAAAGVATALLPLTGRYLKAQADRAMNLVAVDRLFTAAGRLTGLARFEDPAFQDRLRLAQQAGSTSGELVEAVFGLARAGLMLAGFLGALLVVSRPMTVLVLAAALPALGAELALARRRADVFGRIEPIRRREFFFGRLLTGIDAATEIRLFGTGDYLRGRMLRERRSANEAQRRMDRRELITQAALAGLGAAAATAGLLWSAVAARQGRLTVGDVTMFVAAVAGVQAGLDLLVRSLATGHQQLLLFARHSAVVHGPPDLPVPAAPAPAAPLAAGVHLRDVWFRYSEDHPWILRGVRLTLPRGATVALVGANGAGKSTLVKLLCRMYDPTRGSIHWDGLDLRECDPAALRARLSVTFQEHMNYDLTAAENIALGDLSAGRDADRVRAAAEAAGVHETLDALPRGYDTLLTRQFSADTDSGNVATGVVLSGGQWQRLAVARAFLRRDRDLLILDEPSAGLDPRAEHELQLRLRRYRRGATTLLISHRLNTVREADLIVVLDEGRVVEQGTHDALLRAQGRYAELFQLQAAGYREAPAATVGQPG